MPRLAINLVAAAVATTLVPTDSSKLALYGAAGTGPATVFKEWASAFVAQHPDEVDISVWLSTGSHAQKALVGSVDCASKYRGHPTLCSSPPAISRTDFGAGGVVFSSSWYSQYSSLDIQQLPALAGPICVVYSKDITGNLGSIEDGQLNLTMEVVGAIYGGHISFWDDHRVQVLNPMLTLPHERITAIARSDKSSLNDAITTSISFANPWWTQVPGYMGQSVGKKPKWPLSNFTDAGDPYYLLQGGQEGIIVSALRTPFSLAYVDFTQIRRFGEFLGMAQIISNFSGMPVPPTPTTVQNAIDAISSSFGTNNSRMELSALNPQREQAYPITRFTYWYVTKSAAANEDCFRTWLLKEFVLFSYSSAASTIADRTGWVTPPMSLIQAVRANLMNMHCMDNESGAEMSVMAYTPPKYRQCPMGQFVAPRPNGSGIESHLGCRDCSAGTYQPQHFVAAVFQCNSAPTGAFVPRAGQATFEPCASGSFSRTTAQSSCELCPAGTFSPTSGFTECANCPAGTSTRSQQGALVCEPCAVGYYADSPGTGACQRCPASLTTKIPGAAAASLCSCPPGLHMDAARVCRPCGGHEGLVCPGGGEPAQAAPGYMLLEAAGQPGPLPAIYRCTTRSFCPGGGPRVCAGGRTGTACSRCPEGRTWDGSNCQVCSKSGGIWLGFWLFAVVAASLAWFGVEIASKNAMVGGVYFTKLAIAGSVTSLVSVFQVVGLISILSVPWPESLISFINGSGIFVLDIHNLLALDCLTYSAIGQYAIVALTIPVAILTMVSAQAVRCLAAKVAYNCPDFLNVSGALGFIAITPLMSTAVAPMVCYTHPASVKSLTKFPSVLCGSAEHHGMLALGLALFLLGLFIMAALAMVTWWAPSLAAVPGRRAMFLRAARFMLLPYREDRWFAGCLLAPRGILAALVPVIFADSVPAQVTFFVLVLLLCMTMIARLWPWRLPSLNLLNLVVLETLVVAMTVVGVAFVPATIAGSSASSAFAGILQVILMFSIAFVGVLVAIVAAGTLARLCGLKTEESLRAMLQLRWGRYNPTDLTQLLLKLASLPQQDVLKAVASLEIYDQQMLRGCLSAFKELETAKTRHDAWEGPVEAHVSIRLPSRCMSESSLAREAAECAAVKKSEGSHSQGNFNKVVPTQESCEAQPVAAPSDDDPSVKDSCEVQIASEASFESSSKDLA